MEQNWISIFRTFVQISSSFFFVFSTSFICFQFIFLCLNSFERMNGSFFASVLYNFNGATAQKVKLFCCNFTVIVQLMDNFLFFNSMKKKLPTSQLFMFFKEMKLAPLCFINENSFC